MERSAGILLPIFSLPGKYGVGSLGKEARDFADFLRAAGQRWWQILPVGPVGAGNSPYASESTFAGNPLFIDLPTLAQAGFLSEEDLKAAELSEDGKVDYGALAQSRDALLRKAFSQARDVEGEKVSAWANEHFWVKEYAIFKALHIHFNAPWFNWPDEALRRHEWFAVQAAKEALADEVAYQIHVQYWFFTQWAALKSYVNSLGIQIIGDMPIYVSLDSADVWSERKEFLLDSDGHPKMVAGVPPDYFSEDGQLWGNPLYNWDSMRWDGWGWWIRRIGGASQLFDMIRIDHFRGLESYWAVPAGAKSAKEGHWEKGPGMDMLRPVMGWFPQVRFIAEDLGLMTPAVVELLRDSGLPGMKVLQFAFDNPGNAYLPHNCKENSLCYTGTHDNDTLYGWLSKATREEKAFIKKYLGAAGKSIPDAVLRAGQGSRSFLFVAQLQDYLCLGSESRINTPGTAEGNWAWRVDAAALTEELADFIRDLTATFARCASKEVEAAEKAAKN